MLRLCRVVNARNTICRLSRRCIRVFNTMTSPEIFCWRCDTRSASTYFWRCPARSLVLRALPVHLAHVKTIMLMELRLRVAFSIPCLPDWFRSRVSHICSRLCSAASFPPQAWQIFASFLLSRNRWRWTWWWRGLLLLWWA